MLNPILNKKILEAIIAADKGMPPVGTPPFNPNAGPPRIGPPVAPGPAPVGFEDILGVGASYRPTAIPGPSIWPGNMSPDMPATPSAPWSGYETAGKRQELNIAGLRDEYGKLQESVKKPRAKAKLKTSFSNKDLPIALIGGLMSYLAGGKNPSQSVDQFVQAFAGFNKQRADEENQAEMQRVEEENRAAELEIASQKIGIDLKKLEYDEQDKVLDRFRKEEERTKALEDYAKRVEIDLGADLKKIGVTQSGKLQLKDTEELRKTISTLADPIKRQEAMNDYYAYMASDGSMSVEEAKLLSERYLGQNTVKDVKDLASAGWSAQKTRTAETMLPIQAQLGRLGIQLKEREIEKFDVLFPLLDDMQKADLVYKYRQADNLTNLMKNRDRNAAVAEFRADNSLYTNSLGVYRALMTANSQSATDARARLVQEDATLSNLEFELKKAETNLKSETDPDQKKVYESQVNDYKAKVAAQKAIVDPIRDSIKRNQEEYGEITKKLQDLQKAVESGASRPLGDGEGGGGGGNRSDRNNNPLNIKASNATRAYGGVVGIEDKPAADGGNFLVFDTPESGFKAAGRLIRSGGYRGLTVDAALRRWSNNGYGGDLSSTIGISGSTPMKSLSESQINKLVIAMARREGYTGKIPPVVTTEPKPNNPKNPNLSKVAAGLGMGAIGGLVKTKKKEAPKPKGRVIKVNGVDVEVNEK